MPDEEIQIQQFSKPLDWLPAEDVVASLANQVLAQGSPDGLVYLSFGQVAPPVLLGEDEAKQQRLEDMDAIPVHVVGRVVLPQGVAARLAEIIITTLDVQARAKQLEAEAETESEQT